ARAEKAGDDDERYAHAHSIALRLDHDYATLAGGCQRDVIDVFDRERRARQVLVGKCVDRAAGGIGEGWAAVGHYLHDHAAVATLHDLELVGDLIHDAEQDVEHEPTDRVASAVAQRVGDPALDRSDPIQAATACARSLGVGHGEIAVDVADHR